MILYTQLIYGQKGGVASTFLDTSNVHIFSGYKIKTGPFSIWTHNFIHNYMLQFFFMFYKYIQLIYGQKGGVASTVLDTSNVHIFSGYKIKPSYNLDT